VQVTTNFDGVSILIVVTVVVLAVGTVVALAVLKPYCFPAFQSEAKNDQCVSDNTNLRNYQYRWTIFGIRCFVILPIVPIILYFWISLRPGTEGVSLVKLLMFRQMMEILLITQILLYLLQTLAGWVEVFYPNMNYSAYKNMRLVCTVIPNILVIGATVFLLRRIRAKASEDETKYHAMEEDK